MTRLVERSMNAVFPVSQCIACLRWTRREGSAATTDATNFDSTAPPKLPGYCSVRSPGPHKAGGPGRAGALAATWIEFLYSSRRDANGLPLEIQMIRPTNSADDTRQATPSRATARRRFEIILIRPSHYDDDGYVSQWFRSCMPSNSLAVMNGLLVDAAERHVLGPDVDIHVMPMDEANTRIRPDALIRRIKSAGAGGFVGLVGVQSNQYPRALDIARPFRDAGIPVILGGFHVSGSMAMGVDESLQRARAMGITLYAGEADGRIDDIIIAAAKGTLEPVYNYLNDLPGINGATIPHLPVGTAKRTIGATMSFDAGRGCPFQCSFCTIINVQGRKSRRRTPDDIEQVVRRNLAEGNDRFFVT